MRLYLLPVCLLMFSSCGNEAPGEKVPDAPTAVPNSKDDGQAIFRQYCASCHMLDNDATGPKLRGVLARWNDDPAKVKSFIRNATGMIASGDSLALQAQQRGRGGTMPAFPDLSDQQLDGLLDYFQNGR